MMIQMSILINFKVIFHSWPERESPILWQQTTTLSLITQSLDRLQMITVWVNILGWRIELQFILIRLIILSVCVFLLLHTVWRDTEREAVNLSAEKWGGSAEMLFPVPPVLLQHRKWISATESSCPLVCLEVKTHTHTQAESIPRNFQARPCNDQQMFHFIWLMYQTPGQKPYEPRHKTDLTTLFMQEQVRLSRAKSWDSRENST